jgi:L-malate glycosyltransferase
VAAIRTAHGASERAPRGVKARLRHAVISSLDNWCARHAQSRVIAVSRELGARLAEDFPPEHVVVVENGVDVSAVAAQVAPVDFRKDEPDATHVGIVGRLVPVKRVDLFLHSAALLVREEPRRKWRFHVFGDGPLRADLTRLAAELELEPVARFHGHRSDIVACMAALDVLVMCSDHEGLPMTALEAGVLGVPLVAHAVGGLLDIVPESLLVRAHDAAGYVATIRGVLAAGTVAAAAAMSQRVRSDYSSVRNASRVKLLYEQVRAEAGIAT